MKPRISVPPAEGLERSVASGSSAVGRPRVLVFMEAREFGGPAKNLAATAELLRDLVEFKVVTFIRGDTPTTEFTEQLATNGLSFEVIREGFRYDPRGLTAVRRIVMAYRPDIVQIHNGKSRLYLYLLRRLRLLRDLRTIDCYHGETWTDTKQLAYNQIDRWLFRRATHIIVVSERQVRLLESFGVPRDRITVIYNGIRLQPSVPRAANDPLHIITVGRLSREKGHAHLLASVKALRARNVPSFIVSVVGDGPELDALRARAGQEDLSEVVRFTGYEPDPTAYYEGADLFVLPSLTEGIPNVLLEAGMHHVPIVSTDVGGVPEMFQHAAEALLVPPGDVDALTDAIEQCLTDPDLRRRLAHSARSKVEQQFTDERRAQQYLAYYEALISAHA